LAGGLVLIFGITIAISFLLTATGWATTEQINSLLDRFFAPLVGLTGTALGFYFGGKTRDT
jgi:FtsH-binding integral membrane protein